MKNKVGLSLVGTFWLGISGLHGGLHGVSGGQIYKQNRTLASASQPSIEWGSTSCSYLPISGINLSPPTCEISATVAGAISPISNSDVIGSVEVLDQSDTVVSVAGQNVNLAAFRNEWYLPDIFPKGEYYFRLRNASIGLESKSPKFDLPDLSGPACFKETFKPITLETAEAFQLNLFKPSISSFLPSGDKNPLTVMATCIDRKYSSGENIDNTTMYLDFIQTTPDRTLGKVVLTKEYYLKDPLKQITLNSEGGLYVIRGRFKIKGDPEARQREIFSRIFDLDGKYCSDESGPGSDSPTGSIIAGNPTSAGTKTTMGGWTTSSIVYLAIGVIGAIAVVVGAVVFVTRRNKKLSEAKARGSDKQNHGGQDLAFDRTAHRNPVLPELDNDMYEASKTPAFADPHVRERTLPSFAHDPQMLSYHQNTHTSYLDGLPEGPSNFAPIAMATAYPTADHVTVVEDHLYDAPRAFALAAPTAPSSTAIVVAEEEKEGTLHSERSQTSKEPEQRGTPESSSNVSFCGACMQTYAGTSLVCSNCGYANQEQPVARQATEVTLEEGASRVISHKEYMAPAPSAPGAAQERLREKRSRRRQN